MSLDKRQAISAQVMLRSASGRVPDGMTAITSENIREFLPSKEAAARISRAFAGMGFEVGPTVGNSFSITGPAGSFERVFKTRLHQTKRGGIQCRKSEDQDDGQPGEELPLNALPQAIASDVVAVTFTPPPDFGPSNF